MAWWPSWSCDQDYLNKLLFPYPKEPHLKFKFESKPSSKIFLLTVPKRYLFCGSFMLFLSCVCYAFVRVCLLMSCGHLLGKGWPLGSRLWFLIVSLLLFHWYPGSGMVLDCIDFWPLSPFSLQLVQRFQRRRCLKMLMEVRQTDRWRTDHRHWSHWYTNSTPQSLQLRWAKLPGLPSILSLFHNEFNKSNHTIVLKLDSINLMTLRLLYNLISAVKTL